MQAVLWALAQSWRMTYAIEAFHYIFTSIAKRARAGLWELSCCTGKGKKEELTDSVSLYMLSSCKPRPLCPLMPFCTFSIAGISLKVWVERVHGM